MKKHTQYFAFLRGAVFAVLLLSVRAFSQDSVTSAGYWSIIPAKTAAQDTIISANFWSIIPAKTTTQDTIISASFWSIVLPQAASTTVGLSCTNNLFDAGERATIPIVISASNNLKGSSTQYTARIRFNPSVLFPQFTVLSSATTGNDRVVTIASTRANADTLGTLLDLPFIVMLGRDSCTTVHLDTLIWTDGQASVAMPPQNLDCEICVKLCREGGTRLFNSGGKVNLFQNRPNPFNAMTVIEYEVIENGPTRLAVMDMYGRTIATLVDDVVKPGKYSVSFDGGTLASGTYMAVLQTPTIRKFRLMEVIK